MAAPVELVWGVEAEQAVQRLDQQLHKEPRFQVTLRDGAAPEGGTARLSCVVDGTTHPHTFISSPSLLVLWYE